MSGPFVLYLINMNLLIRKRPVNESVYLGPCTSSQRVLSVSLFEVSYALIVITVSFFPPAQPVTVRSTNRSCVIFGGGVIFRVDPPLRLLDAISKARLYVLSFPVCCDQPTNQPTTSANEAASETSIG